MVLISPEGKYASGITFKAAKEGADLERIVNLADMVVGTIRSWVHDNHISEMLIGMEYAILKRGGEALAVETYRKQINLLHEIEAGLWRWHNGESVDCDRPGMFTAKVRIAEVNPTASKRVATGSGTATKEEMIYASPFQRRDDIRRPTREALADAWAHALAAKLVAGVDRVIDLEELERKRLEPQFTDMKVFKVEVK